MFKMPEIERMEETIDFNFDADYDFEIDYKTSYGFIRSLCVKGLLDDIKLYKKDMNQYKNFVQVGIGGSALGATASFQFLNGIYHNFSNDKKYFALDNLDTERLKFVLSLDLEKTLFHIVSKSGSTTETLSQFFIIYDKMKAIFKNDAEKHFVFTTSDKGFLNKFAKEKGIKTFYIPSEVGGRYSVFTSVGLLILSFLDGDIDKFIEGAKTAVRAFRNGWQLPNRFAAFAVGEYKNSKNMLVMFAYKDRLFGIADWFRQLWAESLGKNGIGQTPINALGVTDQHSQLQLYQEGPKDKAIIFLDMPALDDFVVSQPFEFEYLKNKSIAEIMEVEKNSTQTALKTNGVKCGSIFIKNPDEYSLGALYISLMIATAKAAEILRIDPFDQPGVELGKKLTKESLSNS